jgi:hypothetical protein
MNGTSSIFNRLRSALRQDATVKPRVDYSNTIYAQKASQYSRQQEPNATPSLEFPAIRLDEMVGEFPVVTID